MADYNYLQDIMDSVYGSQYWDQMADDFYRPEQNQQDDERLLDLIRGESRRTALPGGNRGGNAGAAAAMQPVPQAPDMAQSEAGRQYVDKTNLAPQAAAPAASPTTTSHTFNGTPQDMSSFNSIAAEYGATIGSDGNLNMSDAAYAQLREDPRLSFASSVAAPVAAPAAAKPAATKPTSGLSLGSTAAAKPATTTAKPATSSGFNMTTNKVVPASSKPKTASTGIKF
jgi:hypothetical protein